MSSLLATLSDFSTATGIYQKLNANKNKRLIGSAEYYRWYKFLTRVWHIATAVHLNTHRQLLSFIDKKYLVQLYKDFADKIVIKKSVQCGVSEMLIIRAFAYAEAGYYVLYVLPKYDLRGRFVHNRIDPLFNIVPEYRALLKDAVGESESVTLKHLGNAAINFVGSNSESEFIEYPADAIIIDEMDRCYQPNLLLADDRLDASALKQKISVSTPTISNYGIDSEYENTDQRQWQVKCEHCNEWQPLNWEENVVNRVGENNYELRDTEWRNSGHDIRLCCRKCQRPINRLGKGQWVAAQKHEAHGYHLSQLFTAQTTVKSLWDIFQDALGDPGALQVFFNSKLGLAYTAAGSQLTRIELHNCVGDYLLASTCKEYTSMGVDVGRFLYVRISSWTADGKRKAEFIGKVKESSELTDLIKRYNVHTCVVDAYPETRMAKEFQQQHSRAWLCRFVSNLTMVQEKSDAQTLAVDRTQIFDHLVTEIRRQHLILPKNAGLIDEYYDHLQAPTRLQDADTGRNYWTEGTKPDHYFLAEIYDLLASHLMEKNRLVIF